jgi:predicted glutamine amidotransferase
MCQLLGISSNREVDLKFSFREWLHRGSSNLHGYGFAYWDSVGACVVKAASSLLDATTADTIVVTTARSRVFLAHVRFATVGPKDGANTHPFLAYANEQRFAFAHNGTVSRIRERQLRQLRPEGETDSEHAFLFLLEGLPASRDADFAVRLKRLADEVRIYGRFNFLMSDGVTIWAYADNSLHFIERTPPYGGELVQLRDDGYTVSLKDVKRPDERAVLIATQPLTDEAGWNALSPGELLIVRDGRARERLG